MAFQEAETERSWRRSPVEVICDILAVIGAGVEKPTLVAYRSNVSWAVLMRHLKSLEEKGFVQRKPSGKRTSYLLTDRGFDLLATYKKVQSELGISVATPTQDLILTEPVTRWFPDRAH